MTVVRVYQPHTVSHMQRQVMDALQITGERSIVLVMWNSQNVTHEVERCEHCYDPVYGDSDTTGGICPYCFGTTYAHGVKEAHFTSAIFSSIGGSSSYDKSRGEFDVEDSTIQVGPFIDIHEKDYVLKIDGWDVDDGGVQPICRDLWQVKASYNSAYFKDGFVSLGDSNIVGTSLPISRTDQSNPLSDVTFLFDDTRVVTDKQPFVLYPQSGDIGTEENRPVEVPEEYGAYLVTGDENVPCAKAME